MEESVNRLRDLDIALCTTTLIFVCSFPFLVVLGLLSLVKPDELIGSWFTAPATYPFSFSIALFVALCCSAATVRTMREQWQDVNLGLVILSAFLGCSLSALVTPVDILDSLTFILIYIFVALATLIIFLRLLIVMLRTEPNVSALKVALLWTEVLLVRTLFSNLLVVFPYIFVYFSCCFTSNKLSFPRRQVKYLIPILILFLLPYFLIALTVRIQVEDLTESHFLVV